MASRKTLNSSSKTRAATVPRSINQTKVKTMTNTKKALTTAYKNFAQYPSATHWRALESAMLAHQAAHQAAMAEKAYAKVIAQA
jgi:hypothetical protein